MDYFTWLLRSSFLVRLISSYLQEISFFENNNFKEKLLHNLLSGILFCIFFEDYNFNFLNYILFLSLSICTLTDLIERNVYIIIPTLMLTLNIIFKIYNKNFSELILNLLFCLLIFSILYLINYLFKKKYKQDGIGFGDIILLTSISIFFNSFIFFIILFISSSIGSLFILFKEFLYKFFKIINNNQSIPFVPFIFIGTFTYQYLLKYII